jgi:Domain of unknown function (DUF397)
VTPEPAAEPAAKPTVAELGIDLAAQVWQRSGAGSGTIEVAFARTDQATAAGSPGQWVLMRVTVSRVRGFGGWVTRTPERRVLVFDRHEWECFLDGARSGEFDDAAGPDPGSR